MSGGKIVWLASYPKSGNTWTRAFLLHLFANPKQPFAPDEIGEMSPIDSGRYWFELVADKPEEAWTEEYVASLRGPAQREIAKYAPDSIFVKTHCALRNWHGYPMFDLSLTAGAIYVVRNPLDVIASYASHSGGTFDQIVNMMNTPNCVLPGKQKGQTPQLMGDWSQHVFSWTAKPNPALHVMRFEDLVAQPQETFKAVATFLGLNPTPERLERAIDFSSFKTLKAMEEKHGFDERSKHQERFFRSGKIGGWRHELNEDQIGKIVSAHRQQMARFGYVPEGY